MAIQPPDITSLTADLVAAFVKKNTVPTAELPNLISIIHKAFAELSTEPAEPVPEFIPATSERKSLASPDFIISLIDGKPYQSLKRHLSARGITPAEYRARYDLKPDYPMVAPAFSARRSALSKKLGLGRKPAVDNAPPAAPAPKKRSAAKQNPARRSSTPKSTKIE